jgi:hypothetical protein
MEPLPPVVRTRWQKIKYWLWYNLYYKWDSKYRWWKVKRSIKNGKFFKPFQSMKIKPSIPIDDIVKTNQMTHIRDTKIKWEWRFKNDNSRV